MIRPLAILTTLALAGCASSFTAPVEYRTADGPVTVEVTFASAAEVERK